MKVWTERVESILADPKKSKLAAALYFLVDESINRPITRKRTSSEELLMQEAYSIMNFLENESKKVSA